MSADPIDLASDREEIARQAAIQTSRKPEGPAHTGHCLYCGNKVPAPMRWCDAECRDAWQGCQR